MISERLTKIYWNMSIRGKESAKFQNNLDKQKKKQDFPPSLMSQSDTPMIPKNPSIIYFVDFPVPCLICNYISHKCFYSWNNKNSPAGKDFSTEFNTSHYHVINKYRQRPLTLFTTGVTTILCTVTHCYPLI